MPNGAGTGLLIAAVLAGATTTAFAAWQPTGVPLRDEGYAGGRDPSACTDGAGGIYGSWFDGAFYERVQRITIDGDYSPGWPGSGISPYPVTSGEKWGLRIAPDGAGGVFVAYIFSGCTAHCHRDPGQVRLQRMLPNGTAAPGWPLDGIVVSTDVTRYAPLIESDGAGGVLIGWCCYWPERDRIRVQRVDGDGRILWTPVAGVAVAPLSTGTQVEPSIAADGAGGAFVAWTDWRPSVPARTRVFIQHLESEGSVADSLGILLGAGPGTQRRPKLVADGLGCVFAAWEDSSAAGFDIRAQHVNASADLEWSGDAAVTGTRAGDQTVPALLPDGAGGVFIAWADPVRIEGIRLDSSGVPPSPWPAGGIALSTTWGYWPRLVTDGSSGFYAAWARNGPAYATHRVGDGATAPGWPPDGLPLCIGPNCSSVLTDLLLVPDGEGGAIAVWDEERIIPPYSGGPELSFATRIGSDGLVPALASLVSARSDAARVSIVWNLSEPASVEILRSEDAGSSWRSLGTFTSDAGGRLAFEDRDVEPGRRYGYRLVRDEAGRTTTLDEQWIETPARPALRIDGLVPNPAAGRVSVALTLEASTPARLEVLDLAGRRIDARELDSPRPGSRLVAMPGSESLPAGVYLVRLAQGGRVVTARSTLLR